MSSKASREVFWLFAFTALMLMPLSYAVWRQRSRPARQAGRNRPVPTPLPPSLTSTPWQFGVRSYRNAIIALSPSGHYLAAICPASLPVPSAVATPTPTMKVPRNVPVRETIGEMDRRSILVIWRAADRREVGRIGVDDNDGSEMQLQWHNDGRISVSTYNNYQLFRWNGRSLLQREATPHQFAEPDGDSSYVVEKRQFDLQADTELAATTEYLGKQPGIKPQDRYKYRLEAFRISSDRAIAVRRNPALSWDRGNDIDLAIRPSPPGTPLRAAVLIMEPAPTPTPTPTASPTPPPSEEQRAFLLEEARARQEVDRRLQQLMAQDTAPADEVRALKLRMKDLNLRLAAKRRRLFPVAPPPPRKEVPGRVDIYYWDARSGRILWRKRLPSSVFVFKASWSPDGRILALIGTARQTSSSRGPYWPGRGIEFLDADTGRTIASSTLNEDFLGNALKVVEWLPGSTLAVGDSTSDFSPMVRFLNARTGKTRALWTPSPFDRYDRQIDAVSTNAAGTVWAVATGKYGWKVFKHSLLSGPANRSGL